MRCNQKLTMLCSAGLLKPYFLVVFPGKDRVFMFALVDISSKVSASAYALGSSDTANGFCEKPADWSKKAGNLASRAAQISLSRTGLEM